jgi:hypothetical protein
VLLKNGFRLPEPDGFAFTAEYFTFTLTLRRQAMVAMRTALLP